MINWQSFDWQSFAGLMQALSGLVVGIAAVIGAVKVGQRQAGIAERQVGITDRQTQILAKQVELEERTLKADLYDRRYAVYDAAAAFLVEGANGNQIRPSGDVERRFLIAVAECRFLFRAEVYNALREINTRVHVQYTLRRKMESDHRSTGTYAEGEPERELRNSEWLNDRINSLQTLFPELNLFETQAALPAPQAG